MIYGYARVSTLTQEHNGNSLEEQVSALTAYGCVYICPACRECSQLYENKIM